MKHRVIIYATRRVAIMEDIGVRVKSLRIERRFSLRELSKRLSISPATLCRIESNQIEPSVSTLADIAKEFDVSLDYMYYGKIEDIDMTAIRRALMKYIKKLPLEDRLKLISDISDV